MNPKAYEIDVQEKITFLNLSPEASFNLASFWKQENDLTFYCLACHIGHVKPKF